MHISPLRKNIFAVTLIILSLHTFGQTHRYVDPSGSDSGDCSLPGSPCQTINYTVGQSAANDIINLSEGTFSSATLSARITLSGRGAGSIVQGITVSAVASGTDLVSLEHLTVSSAGSHGIEISTSYVRLFDVNSSNHSGRNINIDASSSIQNIEVSNCTLDGGAYGLWINEQTDLDMLTVLNTSMDSNTIGFYSQLGNSASAGVRLSNVLVRNCTFNDNLRKGIYAEKLEDAIFENITVNNSGTDATYGFNNGIDINLKWQAYSNITIRNSRITNSGAIGSNDIGTAPDNRRTSAITIKARTDAPSYNGTPASLSTVTLDGVIINGEVTDLRFGEMGKTDNDGMNMSTIIVQHCSFTNDDLAGLLNEENTNTLTIANNYWGGSAPTGSDIEDYGTSAVTNQSNELADVIVNELHASFSTLSMAISGTSAGGIIQNLPSTTISGNTNITRNLTFISPGAGNLDAGSLTTFENLNLTAGNLTMGSDFAVLTDLTVNTNRDLVLSNYNLILSGTISGMGEITGSATSGLYISGTGSLGTILFTSGSREVERLDMNRSSSGTLTLGSDLDVASLSLTNGTITTGANDLNFTGNTALAGNDNSFVNGNFVHQVGGSPSGNTLFFPIGVTVYRPIVIEGVDQSATTNFTGTVTESTPLSPTSFSGSSLLNKLSTTRYWTVAPSVANVTGIDLITLSYGEEENVSDQSNIRVSQFQAGNWFNLGGSGASPVSSSASPPNTIDLSLGDFALGDETSGTNFTEIATVFVNAGTGNDANDGASSGTAKQTLSAGFNLVQSGGTINIAAGSYGETIEINQPVTIVGTGSPTTTQVSLNADISSSGFSASTVNVNAAGVIQDGIDLAASSGTVNVVAGTFNETLTVGKALTLNGANAGIAGNSASRGAETIVEPSSQNDVIEIDADNVTVDGLQVGLTNAGVGIFAVNNTDLVLSNNVVNADSVGISISSATVGTINVADNLITMSDFTTASTSTITAGIYLLSLTGSVDINLSDNNYAGGAHGIFVFDCLSSNILTLSNDVVTSSIRGATIASFDGVTRASTTINIDGFSATNMSEPATHITNFPEAGIYFYTDGSSTNSHLITATVNNSIFSDTGSSTSDYAGIICGDFSAGNFPESLQDITITECTFSDNENRGILVRGQNTNVSIERSTFTNNGFDPLGSGGNNGFNIVARNNSIVTVSNCYFINPVSQVGGSQFDGLSLQAGSSLTITDSNFDQNGNGLLVGAGVTGIDLSGNYFGSTTESVISGFIGNNDFTPWIGTGTDTDLVTAGFQPDLSTLYVGTSGTQTGGTGRWQEGHDLVSATGTVVLAHADYAETVTVTKSLTFQPTTSGTDTSLDDLIMSGSAETLTLNGNLLINNAVTLTDGIVDVSSGTLRLGASASDLTETANSRITGMVTMDPRAVGTGSINLLGVSIAANAADDLGNVTIVRNAGTNAIITDGPHSSISASWDITVDTQPVNAGRDVTFTWLPSLDNGKDMTMVSAFRNDGSGWTEEAGPQDISALTPRVFTVTGVTGFSEWTMAQDNQPLPVELSAFNARTISDAVELKWTTMTEINSDYFEIQKSKDGTNFLKIGAIDANGSSSERIDYKWVDKSFNVSNSFYRLKIVDTDGSFEYSHIVLVQQVALSELKVFPNPVQGRVTIWNDGEISKYELYDQNGKLVSSGKIKNNKIDLSTLKRGIYYLRVDKQNSVRILKE